MKANRGWEALGLLAAMQLLGRCKKNTFEIAQIYGATAYLKGVQMARVFFLYQTAIFACAMFLVLGVILMEIALVFYIPMGATVRSIFVFMLGGINFLSGFIFLRYFASSKQWLYQVSKYNDWIKSIMEKERKI